MRHELAGAIFAGVLALAGAQIPAASVSATCDQRAGMNGKYAKPSSFAPRERPYKNAYGAPISQPILSKHVHHKAKAQPQLRSSPLPAS